MTSLSPIVWFSYGPYTVMDVHAKQHGPVQRFVLEHFRSCQLFQVLKLQQEPSEEKDLQQILKHILDNESSIIVLDKELQSIKGVALLKCMTKEWRSWTALHLLAKSQHFKELCGLLRWCLQHQNNSGADSLHLFSYHLCEELEKDNAFLERFFEAICDAARCLHLPRVTYMSLSRSEHECMKSAGFAEVVRVIYSMYVFENRRPFERLRDINEMYGVLYEKPVPGGDVTAVKDTEIKEEKI